MNVTVGKRRQHGRAAKIGSRYSRAGFVWVERHETVAIDDEPLVQGEPAVFGAI